jgi:hypothetical protein
MYKHVNDLSTITLSYKISEEYEIHLQSLDTQFSLKLKERQSNQAYMPTKVGKPIMENQDIMAPQLQEQPQVNIYPQNTVFYIDDETQVIPTLRLNHTCVCISNSNVYIPIQTKDSDHVKLTKLTIQMVLRKESLNVNLYSRFRNMALIFNYILLYDTYNTYFTGDSIQLTNYGTGQLRNLIPDDKIVVTGKNNIKVNTNPVKLAKDMGILFCDNFITTDISRRLNKLYVNDISEETQYNSVILKPTLQYVVTHDKYLYIPIFYYIAVFPYEHSSLTPNTDELTQTIETFKFELREYFYSQGVINDIEYTPLFWYENKLAPLLAKLKSNYITIYDIFPWIINLAYTNQGNVMATLDDPNIEFNTLFCEIEKCITDHSIISLTYPRAPVDYTQMYNEIRTLTPTTGNVESALYERFSELDLISIDLYNTSPKTNYQVMILALQSSPKPTPSEITERGLTVLYSLYKDILNTIDYKATNALKHNRKNTQDYLQLPIVKTIQEIKDLHKVENLTVIGDSIYDIKTYSEILILIIGLRKLMSTSSLDNPILVPPYFDDFLALHEYCTQ